MNLKPRRAEEPEINLVSLIDVVLMLVVFFMLSSQFIDEGRVRIHLPQATGAPGAKQQTPSHKTGLGIGMSNNRRPAVEGVNRR